MIQSTFEPIASPDTLPQKLIPNLLDHFSSSAGYQIYPDVLGFFRRLRSQRYLAQRHPTAPVDTVVGMITNSDSRVPSILDSYGLRIGARRFSPTVSEEPLLKLPTNDFDFVTLSYDVGLGKPDRGIFDAAKMCAGSLRSEKDIEQIYIHVGDDRIKDFQAAENAGWKGVWLGGKRRSGVLKPDDSDVLFFSGLKAFGSYLQGQVFGLDSPDFRKQYEDKKALISGFSSQKWTASKRQSQDKQGAPFSEASDHAGH